jgi:glycosyltransferase involved in cell wall biosynthesis
MPMTISLLDNQVPDKSGATGDATRSLAASASETPLVGRKILIIVENLPLPFDRRVWLEARTLKAAGAEVSIICPTGKGYETLEEDIEGVHIYRHPLPVEADSASGYLREYFAALTAETRLAWKIFFKHGFDVVQGCNPPDLIFLVALPFKLLGKKFIFDHHDVNPELYEAKFGRRDFFWRLLKFVERLTFMTADVSIATNESYRAIAIERGKMDPKKVFVVRSGPEIERIKPVPPNPAYKRGRQYLVGYVGVMGDQEGIDLLLESVRHIVHDLGRTDIQFTLAGSGPSVDSLKELSRELKVDDYVAFLGRVPDAELFELLSTADVCVNPDRVNPMNDLSTMNKIMEYMAFAKPIVQYNVAEGSFSAQDASLYAAKNDAKDFAACIIGLLSDENKRVEMGQYGRKRVVEELSWARQRPALLQAYRTALG